MYMFSFIVGIVFGVRAAYTPIAYSQRLPDGGGSQG